MNTTFTKEQLTSWIVDLMTAAKNDDQFLIDWFKRTKESPVSIIGGWQQFDTSFPDLFCTSKSDPGYTMCIKICENNGPYAYTEYELQDMPLDDNGEVENTELILEWEDDPAAVAEFFIGEWERLMEKYN